MAMLAERSRSISPVGNGTRMTSTLATIPTGKIRSCHRVVRPAGNSDDEATPDDIRFSGNALTLKADSPRRPGLPAPTASANSRRRKRGGTDSGGEVSEKGWKSLGEIRHSSLPPPFRLSTIFYLAPSPALVIMELLQRNAFLRDAYVNYAISTAPKALGLDRRTAAKMDPTPMPKKSGDLGSGGYTDKPWFLRVWDGMIATGWFPMLVRNGFRMSPRRWVMSLLMSILSLINLGLWLLQTLIWGRRIARTQLAGDPIFVIGHWRSGTTLLHELLVLDEAAYLLKQLRLLLP